MTLTAQSFPMAHTVDLNAHYRALVPGVEKLALNPLALQPQVFATLQSLIAAPHDATGLTRLLFEPGLYGTTMNWTTAMADQFLIWRDAGPDGYLPSVLQTLCDQFSFDSDHPLMAAAAMASVLGTVPNDLPFHSADHTREVVCFAVALSASHHVDKQFDDAQTQLLEMFIAACIHDFAHDGMGNARMGQHTPMRLEQNALDAALPFLKTTHIPDPSWERISVMVLSTDVSKTTASDTSPAEWMRLAYQGIGGGSECPPFMTPLFDDPSLSLQAALLEDADLAVSGGITYEYARRMTALIAQETHVLTPSPETLIGFIDHICHGAFMTDAARKLFGDNMKRLRTAAKEESADTIYRWS